MDEKQPSAEAMEATKDIRQEWFRIALTEGAEVTLPAGHLALMASALDAFAARSRWQPISEAPEGEHVLLWFPKGERGIGGVECGTFWRDTDGRITCFWTHGSTNGGSDWEARDGEQPTHWQPLPSPPEPPSCP